MKNLIKKLFCFLRVNKGRVRGAYITIGRNNYLAKGVFFSKGRHIKIGNDSYIGRSVNLSCHLEIANKVLIASNVSFVGGDHRIDNVTGFVIDSGRDEIKTIIVEEDVWIGHGAIIMHGVRLSKGCVVAAGSVVTKSVGPFEIVGGNPAKYIRNRVV